MLLQYFNNFSISIAPTQCSMVATLTVTLPPTPTLPPSETDLIIGASVGGALSGLLLIIIAIAILILCCIKTRARNKPSDENKSNPGQPEAFYDVIAEGPIIEHNIQQVTIKTAANKAYTNVTPLTSRNTKQREDDMEDNTAYMGAATVASMREKAIKEECDEYVTMTPQYDILRHSN